MDPKVQKSWENFLNPEVLRPQLTIASIYITAYLILKESIVERIRDFFCNGFNEEGYIIDPEYNDEVLNLNKSPVYASLEWLRKMDAIDKDDIEIFTKIKDCRNVLAHNLLKLITSGGFPQDIEHNFTNMLSLLRKIEIWWIVNVEIPTNPDLEGEDIDESGIMTGHLMTLRLLCEIALGSEEESRFYYEQFKKETSNKSV